MTLIPYAHWLTLADPHAHLSPAPHRVWGCAYRIPAAHVDAVRAYLDIRETNGYTIAYTTFQPSVPSSSSPAPSAAAASAETEAEAGPATLRTLLYIGTPANPQFTGPQDPAALAAHICASKGPSGSNVEYLLELESALRGLGEGSGDAHIEDLAGRVRGLGGGLAEKEGEGERRGGGVHDEEEEVER